MNKYHIRFIIYEISYYYRTIAKKLAISYINVYIQLINFHTSRTVRTFMAASST